MPLEREQVRLNGITYMLAPAEKGRRPYLRATRPSQPSDPGRLREIAWTLSGPLGHSREGPDGVLACDYTTTLDHRWPGLLTSGPARNPLTLTSQDPATGDGTLPQNLPMLLGGFSTTNLSKIVEDRTRLLMARGQALTTVTPSGMAVATTEVRDTAIEDLVVWRNQARVSYGNSRDIDTVTTYISNRPQFSAVSGQRAKEMAVGTARWWGVNASATGANENRAVYSTDDLSTFATFPVGDEKVPATGIGIAGEHTVFGFETGVWGFTDAGLPAPVLDNLRDHRSANNGIAFAYAWGWLYVATAVGLWAVDVARGVANPVGPGEGLDGAGFEGAIDGRPTAVMLYRDTLRVAYLTTTGDTVILWGYFGPLTLATGRPDWFTHSLHSSLQCDAMGGTAQRTNPTFMVGEATNLAWYTEGRRGREIADANYVFSTADGIWYGTTLQRDGAMHKALRYACFITENCDASNTWQLALSPDEGAYVNIGSAVTTNGHQHIRETTPTFDFHAVKPRLTQVAASSSAPPQIRGPLTMVYEERPDTVLEVRLTVLVTGNTRSPATNRANLEALSEHDQADAVVVQLPGEVTNRYCFIREVTHADWGSPEVDAVTIELSIMETG